jgi:hypothetical protein
MHDPEFEKQVQKKLEELQFDPSGEVWTKVEQEIKKEKRKRPLLWIFLLSGLLLSAGYWALVTGNKNNKQTNIAKAETALKTSSETKEEKKKPTDENINAAATTKNSTNEKKDLRENNQPNSNANNKNEITITNKSIAKNNTTIKPKTSSPQKKSLDDKQAVPLFQSKKDKVSDKGKSKKEKVKREPDEGVVANHNIFSEKKNIGIDAVKKENENIAADSQINKSSIADEIKTKKEDLSGKENIATDPQINKTVVAKNINSKKSRSLRLGFTGGAGVSDIETFSSTSSYPANVNSSGGSVTGYNGSPSSIQTGISFYAGAFLEKPFSKKISLSAGLNYHYYSTRIRTGTKVDSVIYVPPAYTNNSSLTSTPQAATYRTGAINNYNNHYHFIELPLLLNLRLNSNDKMPITWRGGFSFSYLINTNGLQFDPSSGVYYKDNSLFNKMQVNGITGLIIGFYQQKNLIQIGPEIQYGITKILHGYITNNQHMLYYGLGISFVPQKK